FIGSHLVDRLIQEGHEVVVLDNLYSGKTENLQSHLDKQSLRLIRGDVRNSKDVKEAVQGVDIIFHLAAIVNVALSIETPLLTNDVNVKGTLNLLEASINSKLQRFVYVSTCAVYGEARYLPIDEEHPAMPLSPYAISKLAAESYCRVMYRTHGLKTICLRFFNVYGSRQAGGPYGGVITRFVDRLKQGQTPIVFGDGDQTRDFVHVDDVVRACILASEDQRCIGEVINIGTGKPTTIIKAAAVLTELLGKTGLKPEFSSSRVGDILHSYADITKANSLIGFKPSATFEEGIQKLLSK
ncbi:MAG: GDP-mannose 4,6-dehydratase, partial [Candidatus Bathyarchaeota archaeon]